VKDSEVSRISVNHTVRDSEIEEAEALFQDIDPGRYRVEGGAVVRFSGEPLTNPRTLTFFAKSWSIVPRFIVGIRTLETALRQAWNETSIWKRECVEEREGRKEDALRRSEGKTGPERELRLVARYLAACAELPSSMGRDPNDTTYVEQLLRRWAGGESVAHELASSVESLEARVREHRAFHAKYDAEQKEEVAALKARLLEAIEEVARGQIRDELKKPLRDAKKRLKASGAAG
jgi:hypothetical protein